MKLLLWPFLFLGHLVAGIVGLLGRFVVILVGMVIAVAGIVLCLTLVGAIVGLPLLWLAWQLVKHGLA
jgi:hypothetical protein